MVKHHWLRSVLMAAVLGILFGSADSCSPDDQAGPPSSRQGAVATQSPAVRSVPARLDGPLSRRESSRTTTYLTPRPTIPGRLSICFCRRIGPRIACRWWSSFMEAAGGTARKAGSIAKCLPFVATGRYAGASIGYRLSGQAIWPAQIHDCKAAIRWLKGARRSAWTRSGADRSDGHFGRRASRRDARDDRERRLIGRGPRRSRRRTAAVSPV